MKLEIVFVLVWAVLVLVLLYTTVKRGKRALSIFPSLDSVNIAYHDKRGSARSDKSFITKLGGMKNEAEIVVTDRELWIKCDTIFKASFLLQYDAIHRISLDKITYVSRKDDKIIVRFKPENYLEKELQIETARTTKFIELVSSNDHIERTNE